MLFHLNQQEGVCRLASAFDEVNGRAFRPDVHRSAATSLGGVESLIEQRVLSDSRSDPCLGRYDDLKLV